MQGSGRFCGCYTGIELANSEEDEPLATGGAISLAIANTGGDEFLVIDGDSFTVGDYRYATSVFGICGRKPAVFLADVAEGRHLKHKVH